MPIPDYQATMLPLLRFAGDGLEHSLRDAIESLAIEFKLSDEERRELLPSGQQEVFANRVSWARTYMKKAGLLRTTRRGFFRDYASRIDSKIVLIDGEQLAQMLIDHNIGVAPVASYEIKRLDSDYFTEQ